MNKRFCIKSILIFLIIMIFFSLEAYCWGKKRDIINAPSLAVIPFENKIGDKAYDKKIIYISNLMIESLYKTKVFRLIEMEKLGEILGDESISKEKLLDNKKAYIEAIKMIGVDLMLFGTLSKVRRIEKKRSRVLEFYLEGRAVRLISGEIICIQSAKGSIKVGKNEVFTQNDYDLALEKAVKKLATRIARKCG